MVITLIILSVTGMSLLYMFGYKIGKEKGTNEQISLLNKEVESEQRIGVLTTNLLCGEETIVIKAEVKEIAKGDTKCKVEYTTFHITPTKHNNQNRWDAVKEYLGPWVDSKNIEWYVEYDTRKRRIQRFLNK